MFLTTRKELKSAFFDGEAFSLSNLELSAFLPWFICEVPEFEEDCDEAVCTTTHLIGDIDDLALLAERRQIDKTYLVSPGYLLNKDSWSLKRLKSVSVATCRNDGYESSVYRYETDSGLVIEHNKSGLSKGQHELTFETILQFA